MRRNAFTLIELLVVIAVIVLLIAILVPSLMQAKSLAMQTVCGVNLRHLMVGQDLYAAGNNERYAGPYLWVTITNDPRDINVVRKGLLYKYMSGQDAAYYCPAARKVLSGMDDFAYTYTMNHILGPWMRPDDGGVWNTQPFSWSWSPEKRQSDIKRHGGVLGFSEENNYTIDGWSGYSLNDGAMLSAFLNTPENSEGKPYPTLRRSSYDCLGTIHKRKGLDVGVVNASFTDEHVELVNYKGRFAAYDTTFTNTQGYCLDWSPWPGK
jgi:prepilin-type N-terminal cleavage/methylation domain-containing protein